jgi:CRAL/TRIO domain
MKNPAFQGEGMDAWFSTAQVQLIRRCRTDNQHHRDYLYIDAAKADPSLYSRECALKGILYLLHALLEDEEVQKKGLIAISNSDGVSQRNRDTLLTKALIELAQGAFPIRLSAVHCCNLPTIFNVIMRFFLALIGERLRKRIIVHCEVGPDLLTKLVDDYGFKRVDIPTQMGGERQSDFSKWIEERSQQCL